MQKYNFLLTHGEQKFSQANETHDTLVHPVNNSFFLNNEIIFSLQLLTVLKEINTNSPDCLLMSAELFFLQKGVKAWKILAKTISSFSWN